MNYVKQILFPDEKVLYSGHVHPRVLLHGIVLLAAAACISFATAQTGGGRSFLLSLFQDWGESSSFFRWISGVCRGWQAASPSVALEYKFISLGVCIWGLKHFLSGILVMQTTELVVTDTRIIAKVGILNVLTLEMDRRRVAEVLIDQSMWGRILNYGHIYIRGFTGVIGGLPVMVNPRLIEQYIMRG